MPSDYPAFRKIPRYFRDIVITEKIDGTNGLISITSLDVPYVYEGGSTNIVGDLSIRAGSRNRWLTLEDDNFSFAAWVTKHSEKLAELGPGNHYGEWWGAGIQRGYGLTNGDKRFSLFNTSRWHGGSVPAVPGLGVVPKLYEGPNDHYGYAAEHPAIEALDDLRYRGSLAAPGFMNPEGVVIYHTAARAYSKVTLGDDGLPKGQAA